LDAAAGYRFEAAVVLALKAGTLGVTHSVRRVKDRDTSSGRQTRLVVGELKTPKLRRTLALTSEMVAMFRQHRVR
jgi:integrase